MSDSEDDLCEYDYNYDGKAQDELKVLISRAELRQLQQSLAAARGTMEEREKLFLIDAKLCRKEIVELKGQLAASESQLKEEQHRSYLYGDRIAAQNLRIVELESQRQALEREVELLNAGWEVKSKEISELKAELARAKQTIEWANQIVSRESNWQNLVEKLRIGDCWCPVGINDPRFNAHTSTCKEITAFVSAYLQLLEGNPERRNPDERS